MYLKGEIIIMKKIKEFFADMTETVSVTKLEWNFDRCDRSAFRRDHRDADLTAQKCKIWLW